MALVAEMFLPCTFPHVQSHMCKQRGIHVLTVFLVQTKNPTEKSTESWPKYHQIPEGASFQPVQVKETYLFGPKTLWDRLLPSLPLHGCCWETFYIFAYCRLVVEIRIHLTAKTYIFAPLPSSTKFVFLLAQSRPFDLLVFPGLVYFESPTFYVQVFWAS